MRKITKKTCQAFKDLRACKMSNTETFFNGIGMDYYLHGNLIATYNKGVLLIKDAGRQSNTTKERLNGILSEFGLGGIFQKNYQRYYTENGKEEKREGRKTFKID